MSEAAAEPVLLHVDQLNVASHLLGRAFQEDPLMVYLVPDAEKRRHLLPTLFQVVARYCLYYGKVYTTLRLDALACCLQPGQKRAIGRLILTGLKNPPIQLGLGGLRRFLHASRYSDQAHEQAISGAHWYVWALGVEPERQGQGFGGKLLQAILQEARVQNLPCCLDTHNPRNVSFYERYGFRQVGKIRVPDSDLHVYALLWEPR